MDPDQTAPIGAVLSGSTLFASILKLVSNVWQLFAAEDFSRGHFSDAFFCALKVKIVIHVSLCMQGKFSCFCCRLLTV